MKYIFLLALFIITFTLMYLPTLEFLGLALFFVVNTIYSALLGMDLSTFYSNVFSGEGKANRWVLILVSVMLLGLVLNFSSSVMTMMTLGNLKYKFGAKGEKILFSPDSRKSMNHIEGLFVSTIVLITVLSFRIYFSPTEMAANIFKWANENIPDVLFKWGHLILMLVAVGLGLTIKGYIDKGVVGTDVKFNTTEHSGFITNFMSLFYVLLAMFLFYLLPTFTTIPVFGPAIAMLFGASGSTTVESMGQLYTNNSISLYTVLKWIFVITIISIAGKLDKSLNDENRSIYTPIYSLGYAASGIYLLTMVGNFFANLGGTTNTNGNDWNTRFNMMDIVLAFCVFVSVIPIIQKNTNETSTNDINDTTNVYYKILMSLLIIWPVITGVLAVFGYNERDKTTTQSGVNSGFNDKLSNWWDTIKPFFEKLNWVFLLNLVDAFSLVKTFLLCLVVVFAGLTINQYVKIRDLDKYISYYHFKDVFAAFMSFLFITVSMSLFNATNVPRIMTVLIDYMMPLAVVIMTCLLVVYTNKISLLSKKEPIADVAADPAEETRKFADTVIKDVAGPNVYDGTPNPKI